MGNNKVVDNTGILPEPTLRDLRGTVWRVVKDLYILSEVQEGFVLISLRHGNRLRETSEEKEVVLASAVCLGNRKIILEGL